MSGSHASRAAEHHWMTTKGHIPRAQHPPPPPPMIDVSYGTVQVIITSDLNMHCIAPKLVPRLLNKSLNSVPKSVKISISVLWMTQLSYRWSSLEGGGGRDMSLRVRPGGQTPVFTEEKHISTTEGMTARPRPGSSFCLTLAGLLTAGNIPGGQTVVLFDIGGVVHRWKHPWGPDRRFV